MLASPIGSSTGRTPVARSDGNPSGGSDDRLDRRRRGVCYQLSELFRFVLLIRAAAVSYKQFFLRLKPGISYLVPGTGT